jgi:hypothetical protein
MRPGLVTQARYRQQQHQCRRPEQQRQQQRDICGYLSDHGAGR